MTVAKIASMAGLAMLCGCGSVPRMQSEYGLRISDIVDNVRCELKAGRNTADFLREKKGWNAAVDLSLNVVANAGGGIGGGNEVPYTPQVMTLALSTDVSGSADRKVGFVFTTDLGKEDTIECGDVIKRRRPNSRLVGDLGITTWLQEMQNIYHDTQARPDTVSYILEFTVLQSADSSIKIVKIPNGESTTNLGFSLKGSWKDVNKLTITFKPNPEATKGPPPSRPKRVTKLPPGDQKKLTPPPPPVDPNAKGPLLQDLQFLLLQQELDR
ncbi:hypothetical protein [Mesorhizobium sp. M0243]|uniref:hypothetical protein n=1 Tax=Mesorhizobium sp. M0243 TaxID=2956925 RepID=UPI003336BF18